ncbi:MAG TPA: hypothetical protein VL966_03235 [Alphaproteobacteria bacterium]|jgi:hypothetical protein|nr:hypothetical protein [Alphaproteobacteria bacterium]
MADTAKDKLVDFLERRAFDPVLKAKPEHYPEPRRGKLEDVQRRTRTEVERFHGYGSARDVVVNFLNDLDSEPAQRIHRELHALGLPTLNDIEDEFMKLADDLHVNVHA